MKKYYNDEGAAGKYIMQKLIAPPEKGSPEALAEYEALGKKRIHWMDANNMPGCNQINSSWYYEANREQLLAETEIVDGEPQWPLHKHATNEILCFYGSDPDDRYNLNAEIEVVIDDEIHVLTKSTLIFVPAGVPHSTPIANRISRPVFHFSMVLSDEYDFIEI